MRGFGATNNLTFVVVFNQLTAGDNMAMLVVWMVATTLFSLETLNSIPLHMFTIMIAFLFSLSLVKKDVSFCDSNC